MRRPLLLLAASLCFAQESPTQKVPAPRIWNDQSLADWAAPIVGLDVRPSLFSEKDYYSAPPEEWVRTYPVYFPGREPAGYWETMRNKKPEPLIVPGPRTQAEWVASGQIVFRELDFAASRTYDLKYFAILRSAEKFKKLGGHPQKDGTVDGIRLVPTSKGLAIAGGQCSGCHIRTLSDGSRIEGPSDLDPGDDLQAQLLSRGDRTFYQGESSAMIAWRSFAVPWIPNDIHAGLRVMPHKDLDGLNAAADLPGMFARFNGSPYYPTKIPDLIGAAERKYIDATATHRLRSPEDIARYAALVTCCDRADFGPHRLLSESQRTPRYTFSDDLLYALAQYIASLRPPANPNLADPRTGFGKKIFEREGCPGCHTPPLYTNNKLTLAQGYRPPKDHPFAADILSISVGTDPNLAIKTRKGTGLYKVPSLKGVWYRGLYGHDGSVASLEDWFNPARLRDDFVPTAFKGYKVEHRAVPGHNFGLNLEADEKTALIAFLRTL
jgi:hypothetical protein